MPSVCDRAGFPLLRLAELGLEVQLWPVAKVQFERFLAEPDGLGDNWYEEVLKQNARVSWRSASEEAREQLLLTAVLPAEALRFAAWLGAGFDLPTLEEWRNIHRALAGDILTTAKLVAVRSQAGEAARGIMDRLIRQLQPRTMLDLSLMRGGVVEWVREGRNWTGLGCPREAFWPNVWDPLTEAVRPIDAAARLPYFGFRLVRRGR
jgi:formylglycine-generating enzyme required for sulfatase activity